jgi:ABC-2 type transport system ATP-binding protein
VAGATISVRGLRKVYDGNAAVDGVDLDVAQGEIFALLGPNGAGKTTTVEILEGYRKRDGGEVSVLGVEPGRASAARFPARPSPGLRPADGRAGARRVVFGRPGAVLTTFKWTTKRDG